MRPLYESICDKFELLGGERTGIAIGLLPCGGDHVVYFDIPTLKKKPINVLFSKVYPTGNMAYVEDVCVCVADSATPDKLN